MPANQTKPAKTRRRGPFVFGIVLFTLVLLFEIYRLVFVSQQGFAVATSWILIVICVLAIAWGVVGLARTTRE